MGSCFRGRFTKRFPWAVTCELVSPMLMVPPGHEMGMLLHCNLALHPATLPFIPVFLLVWGNFFLFCFHFPKQKNQKVSCVIWCGKQPYQWSSHRLAVLPSPMEWESGLAKWDFQWSVSNPSSLSNYFFPSGFRTLFLPNRQTISGPIWDPFCCVLFSWDHTTPTNISGLTKQKLHLDLYNHHSAFISIMERQFPIKFQSSVLAQRDSKTSDHRGKSCYLHKALFIYVMQLDICVYNYIQTGTSDFDFIYNQIHLRHTYISGRCC